MTNVSSSSQELFFDARFLLTPSALANSLIGYESLIDESIKVMRRYVGVRMRIETRIVVRKVEGGSSFQDLGLDIIFGSEKQRKKFIAELRKRTGLDQLTLGKFISTLAVVGVLAVASKYVLPDHAEARTVINNTYNNCSVQVNIPPEVLKDMVAQTVKKEKLDKAVMKILRPNQTKPDGELSLKVDGDTLSIPAIALADIPIAPPEDNTSEIIEDTHVPNATIIMRTADLDNPLGWSAVVIGVSKDRLPINLGHDVDFLNIPFGKPFTGDVRVVRERDKKGNIVPKSYILETYDEQIRLEPSEVGQAFTPALTLPPPQLSIEKSLDVRINSEQEQELNYWSKKLGVTEAKLTKAIEDVGPVVKDVRRRLQEGES